MMNQAILCTIGTIIGIIAGGLGVTWTAKDRMKKEIEETVTERVTTATRLTRLEERLKALDARTTNQP